MDILGELIDIKHDIADCRLCGESCQPRAMDIPQQAVRIMVVAHAPKYAASGDENRDTVADFVLSALRLTGLCDEGVYFTYLVNCPDRQRNASAARARESCIPFLRRQFKLLSPEITVAIGTVVSKRLIGADYNPATCRAKPIGKGKTMFFGVADPFSDGTAAARDSFLNDILCVADFCKTYPSYKPTLKERY